MNRKNIFKKIGLLLIAIMLSISFINLKAASTADSYFVYNNETKFYEFDMGKFGVGELNDDDKNITKKLEITFNNNRKSDVLLYISNPASEGKKIIDLKDGDLVEIEYKRIEKPFIPIFSVFNLKINNEYIYEVPAVPSISVLLFDLKWKIKEITNHTNVADLPDLLTLDYSDRTKMANVIFNNDGYTTLASIVIDGNTHQIPFTFTSQQDMTLFENNYENYYFTDSDGNKIILMNHGNNSLFNYKGELKPTFIPFSLWNLTTNEIKTYKRFNVYVYTQMEKGNNAYAYFYVDQFVIDNLVNASVGFRYRYKYFIGGYGDYNNVFLTLEKGEYKAVDKVKWHTKALGGLTVVSAGLALIPGIGTPFLFIATAGAIMSGASVVDDILFVPGRVEEIQKISNPSEDLKNKIINQIKKEDYDFTSLDKNLFKLHLGQYNKFFTSGIDIDKNYTMDNSETRSHTGFNIAEFTYETDGTVYTIKGNSITPVLEVGHGTDGDGLIENNNQGLILIGLVALAVGYIFLDKKAYKSKSNFAKFAIIIAAIVLIIMLIVSSWQSILGIFE